MSNIYTQNEPHWEPPGIGAIDRLRYHAEAGQDESVAGHSTRLIQVRPDEIMAALAEIAARERAAREKALEEAVNRAAEIIEAWKRGEETQPLPDAIRALKEKRDE